MTKESSSKPAIWKNIVAGGTAGACEILVMYPTDIAKTRAQLSTTSVSMIQTLSTVVKEQGVRGLYRGIITPLCGEAPKRACKFSANEYYKGVLSKRTSDGKLTIGGGAVAGALAGVTEALVNTPFETIKVRMQAKENLTKYKGSMDCFVSTIKTEGLLAVYKGLEPTMCRNAMWNGTYFGTIGLVNIKYPVDEHATKQEKLSKKFLTGTFGSMLGTLTNTPFDVVKSRMQQQATPVAGEQMKYRNAFQSLGVIAREEGVPALYKGLGPRLVRLGPGGGIMIVAFDFISGLLNNI